MLMIRMATRRPLKACASRDRGSLQFFQPDISEEDLGAFALKQNLATVGLGGGFGFHFEPIEFNPEVGEKVLGSFAST